MRKVYLLLALILVGALPGHVCAKEISVSGEEPVKVLVHDHGLEAFQMFMQCIDSANSYVELCPCMTGGELT